MIVGSNIQWRHWKDNWNLSQCFLSILPSFFSLKVRVKISLLYVKKIRVEVAAKSTLKGTNL